jgi:hypothetical protein
MFTLNVMVEWVIFRLPVWRKVQVSYIGSKTKLFLSMSKLCYDWFQPASLSWCQTVIWDPREDFYYCQTVVGLLTCGAFSDERMVLLHLLLVLASAVIPWRESRWTQVHILLSQD